MTRFARAKGSKSSNERVPEDSTPWEVMKDQMLQAKKAGEDSKHREEAEKQRIENYEKFLKDHKTQKRKATWCDFPESQTTITSNKTTEPAKKKNKTTADEKSDSLNNDSENNLSKKSKKKKPKSKNANPNSEKQPTSANENKQSGVNKKDDKVNKQNDAESATIENKESLSDKPAKKKKKNKKFEQKTGSDDVPSTENKQKNKNPNQNANENNQKVKKKKKKQVNGEPVRRKPVNDTSFQLIINGKEVELVRYDGFPIMKKDAERLAELKANMIKKGIPKSEVQRTMKLERRRAEKALARVKRDVCYNCRKGGHNLSDCPDLKTKIPNVGAPDGLCFKCGSTEHRQFECKVQKDGGFRFATCFICKEPGHIARQCPDNPKGLYPNGGSCKLCGDVTHLRKDCPTVQDKREDSSIKLQTLDSTELEGITQTTKNTASEMNKKPKKITF